MSFYEKYEILQLLRDDAPGRGLSPQVKTFSARHLASGHTVGVHLLFDTQPGQVAALLERVQKAGPEKSQEILEVGSHEGTSYVVTSEWIGMQSFDQWIGDPAHADRFAKAGSWKVPTSEFSRKSDPGPVAPAPGPVPLAPGPSPLAPEPGGFTRMFSTSPSARKASDASLMHPSSIHPSAAFISPEPSPAEPEPVVPTPEPQEPQPPTPPKLETETQLLKNEPGEFTRMFQVPSTPPVAQALAPVAEPTPKSEPGEFTRMFQVPVTSAGEVKPAPVEDPDLAMTQVMAIPAALPENIPVAKSAPPAQAGPGDFTRIFQAAPGALADNVPAAKPTPPAAAPPTHSGPGEFTRIFQAAQPTAPTAAAPAPPNSPPASGPGEFTRMFQSPVQAPMGEPENAPRTQPAAPANSGPGEFTRFFQTPVEAPAQRPHPALNDPFGKAAPSPNTPPRGGAGEFTQMFGVPSRPGQSEAPGPYKPSYPPSFAPSGSQSATGAFAVPSTPLAPTSASPSGGPGEYTRMFAAPAAAPAATAAPAPASSPLAAATGTKPNYLPLVIIFGVLFLIAAGLVIYFLLHR